MQNPCTKQYTIHSIGQCGGEEPLGSDWLNYSDVTVVEHAAEFLAAIISLVAQMLCLQLNEFSDFGGRAWKPNGRATLEGQLGSEICLLSRFHKWGLDCCKVISLLLLVQVIALPFLMLVPNALCRDSDGWEKLPVRKRSPAGVHFWLLQINSQVNE